MASSLFPNQPNNNGPAGVMNMIKSMGNPKELYNNLMKQNPQFNQFVNENAGKSPSQIAKENGIDLSMFKQFFHR